jgi:eukaryotic-like serine/threonine-protein kinase
MPLRSGTRLGVYEIVGILGAGGMGEVYRARDPRLGRDVAVKVLPPLLARDPSSMARFEREMKALASLSHPHIVAIHDIGTANDVAYAVTELLEGESLAGILERGALPIRKATEYGIQIARALAAAHERGIVHRDLKPANVFVTSDGHVKVLDFGLARTELAAAASGMTATATGTSPGSVMGTVGYMAPEQARALRVDHRADIFAFGCVMYEMAAGRRAFQRDSAADTLSAILKEDPPPLSAAHAHVPPALERVIQRCLEKNPAERFQSARDLAFALEALSTGSGTSVGAPVSEAPPRSRVRHTAIAAAAAALMIAAFLLGRAAAPRPANQPAINRLTFERGIIRSARFASDGQTVVYGAAWNGGPIRTYVARLDTGESKPMDVANADVLALNRNGDMLLSLDRRYPSSWVADGTLARGRLFASGVRELLEHVRYADFLPDDRIAIVRRVNARDRVEVPQGNVVFETPGYISHMRVAPDGRRVAFLEHPMYGDNRGYVDVYDGRNVRRLTPEYQGVEALAWSATGREIWYSGTTSEVQWPIRAIDADTEAPNDGRVVWYVPSDALVQDIDAHGRVLIVNAETTGALMAAAAGDVREHDRAYGVWAVLGGISRDGKYMLNSSVDVQDPEYTVDIRDLVGSPPVHIGRGRAQALSADNKWALSITPSTPNRVLLYPTGAGESREIQLDDVLPTTGTFVPPGLTVAIVGRRNGSPVALIADVTAGTRRILDLRELNGRAFSLRRYLPTFASPDGSLLAVEADDGKVLAWKISQRGPARELASLKDNEAFLGWSQDASRIHVVSWDGPKARIDGLDIDTGRRSTLREIIVEDLAGSTMIPDLELSADARSYVYGFTRMQSSLYLVTGLR